MGSDDTEEIKKRYFELRESYKSTMLSELAVEKMDKIQLINDVLSGLELQDEQFYYKELVWLTHQEIGAMRGMMAEQTNTYSVAMDSMIETMEELRKGYFGNIIAVMGIFLAIFALIMGNIQLFQALGKDSLDKTIMYLFCGETFLVICILSIIIGIGYLVGNSTIIKNTGKFIRAIVAMIFSFPIYIYIYHYRYVILNWPLWAAITICILFFVIIIGLTNNKSELKQKTRANK